MTIRTKIRYIREKANTINIIQGIAGAISIYGFLNPTEGISLPSTGMSIVDANGAGTVFLPFFILGFITFIVVWSWRKLKNK